jgi:hypothetical protein
MTPTRICLLTLTTVLVLNAIVSAQEWPTRAEPWRVAYTGADSTGPNVLGHWSFSAEAPAADSSSYRQPGELLGAKPVEGRFGGGIESFLGFPTSDARHALMVKLAPHLSPSGPFTLELWLKPSPEFETITNCYLVDKRYVAHTDYQWMLERPGGQRDLHLRLTLGFGDSSDTALSQPIALPTGVWSHLAVTYDGRGGIRFFQDGAQRGERLLKGRGGVTAGSHALSIGDRLGSNYAGVPAVIDEVRLTSAALEFRPVVTRLEGDRHVFRRMEPATGLRYRVRNLESQPQTGTRLTVRVPGQSEQVFPLGDLAPAAEKTVDIEFNTALRPDLYPVGAETHVDGPTPFESLQTDELRIVPRPLDRMPVLNWGLYGTDDVIREIPRMKSIGFTHSFGLVIDNHHILEHPESPFPAREPERPKANRLLDTALAEDFQIALQFHPADTFHKAHPELTRVDRAGKPYTKVPGNDLNGLAPEAQAFHHRVGDVAGRTYGTHPAVDAALVNSELRDHAWLSFSELDRAEYKRATGLEIPDEATTPYGVSWNSLKDFPANRVIADDHPLLTYFRWYHAEGYGLGKLNSALVRGLREGSGRKDLWTFFDPAVRSPSLWGSGGDVDVLSQWTYSYPDPIRIALPTDELFTMARGHDPIQRVMKMTQVIWYRSQSAPIAKDPAKAQAQSARSPWEDQDPTGQYITIAPHHLREAFWTKISRPIQGIMYHGWSSLVPTDEPSAYRFTNSQTQHELTRLVHEVLQPLGPTLKKVPHAPRDVAFLESFTSQMFAHRGAYGWSHTWTGDCYLALLYAQLQPEVLYEQSLLADGLERFKVLVLPDCDVLTKPVVDRILAFQMAGGLIVADERLCPAIKADITLPAYARVNKAADDKQKLLEWASELRSALDPRYTRPFESSDPEVVTVRRRAGESDYLFAINDHREAGDYVGHHGLVLERGLPARTVLRLQRPAGVVYDLVQGGLVPFSRTGTALEIPLELSPCDGRLLLVTPTPISEIRLSLPGDVKRGQAVKVRIEVVGADGQIVPATLPLDVQIRDGDGRTAEFSGFHAAENGQLELNLTIAPNDAQGAWDLQITDLASRLHARGSFRVTP